MSEEGGEINRQKWCSSDWEKETGSGRTVTFVPRIETLNLLLRFASFHLKSYASIIIIRTTRSKQVYKRISFKGPEMSIGASATQKMIQLLSFRLLYLCLDFKFTQSRHQRYRTFMLSLALSQLRIQHGALPSLFNCWCILLVAFHKKSTANA